MGVCVCVCVWVCVGGWVGVLPYKISVCFKSIQLFTINHQFPKPVVCTAHIFVQVSNNSEICRLASVFSMGEIHVQTLVQ